MNRVEIFDILKDWNFWEKPWDEGVKRDSYLNKMSTYLKTGQILVITGARRSGKSFLMKQLASRLVEGGVAKRNVLFVNLEDPRWIGRETKLLDKILETYRSFLQPDSKPYIFLDEIQEIKGWEKWVRVCHELNRANIIISGSNAKLLSRELGTTLTARHVDILVYPLSFQEFLNFKGADSSQEDPVLMSGYLQEYLAKGSFPALALLEAGGREWLMAYYKDVLERDLVNRFNIRKTEKLKMLLNFYMSNVAKPMTFNSASKFLKLSPDTVEKFISYFEQSYLLFLLPRFSFSFKEQQKSPRKIYAIDTFLASSVGFRMSDDFGRMAENIVYLDYLHKQANHTNYEIFYWRDEQAGRDGKEIDFVVKAGGKILEITQVCMGQLREDTKKREMRAILKATKKLKPEYIFVITEEYEGLEEHEYGKVNFIPLWKWLLRKSA